MTTSRPASHFQNIYRGNPDPWSFGSPYEQAKYHRTLAALGQRSFASALEVGCSIGVLTRLLAPRCTRLLGIDIVEEPLQSARLRCADAPHVSFRRMTVPNEWPDDRFDLILFSEVLYFLSPEDIDRCAKRVCATSLPNPVVLLVNWLGPTDDPTPGNSAAERFIAASGRRLTITHQERHESYRLDMLSADTSAPPIPTGLNAPTSDPRDHA